MTQRIAYETLAADGMKALGGAYGYLAKSGLPSDLVNFVFLRASQINGCAYCVDMHSRDLRKTGVAIEKVLLVSAWREAGEVFTPKERAALTWAESLTLLPKTGAPDADFAVVAAEFSEAELAALTVAIALMNAYNRIAVGSGKGPEIIPL